MKRENEDFNKYIFYYEIEQFFTNEYEYKVIYGLKVKRYNYSLIAGEEILVPPNFQMIPIESVKDTQWKKYEKGNDKKMKWMIYVCLSDLFSNKENPECFTSLIITEFIKNNKEMIEKVLED